MDNFGLTRQSKPAIINREYVIDYTNPYNRDLMVYEEGSYVTSYTYGLGLNRISQTVMNYPNKTEVGIEGQNSYTDLAMEKYAKLYFHQDRLGSTIRMTRENGTTIAWADYDEWGKPRSPRDHSMNMAGVDNAIGFTSYTYDVVLDKFFAQARFYDASNRRFMQEDPIKDGLNWYAYCGNSPIVFVDPSGLIIQLSCNASEDDRRQYERAIAYLKTSETASALIARLSKSSEVFTVEFVTGGRSSYNAETNTIKWDRSSGVFLIDGESLLSPALMLAHEMGHAAQDLDGILPNRVPEELRPELEVNNLANYEIPIAKELGEYIRTQYLDAIDRYYPVNNSTDWGIVTTHFEQLQYLYPSNWGKTRRTFENKNSWKYARQISR